MDSTSINYISYILVVLQSFNLISRGERYNKPIAI